MQGVEPRLRRPKRRSLPLTYTLLSDDKDLNLSLLRHNQE
jgi:hypothetical protein